MISDELRKGDARGRVEYLLSKYPNTRGSDKHLIVKYMRVWHRLHKKVDDETMEIVAQIIFEEMPSFETITRIRRKFQESGNYLPSPEVVNGRAMAEQSVREWSRG